MPVEFIKEEKTFFVKYNDEWYDIARFLHLHPGGVDLIRKWENQEISMRMESAHKHSYNAKYLLREYKIENESEIFKKDENFNDKNTKVHLNGNSYQNGTDSLNKNGDIIKNQESNGNCNGEVSHKKSTDKNHDKIDFDDSMEVRF